ncbi:MFS transporter [Sporolactobacillus shoreicorticis]|uniref:MFS transporter n=1 Tax=Sporolactobacillus shoreicorticis TaxID=1923877 RepID=A0ABW5S203_9BACL|nr:MFS transporter [Sporolactobacillus shoreicorticis]MCO7126497.1 MFS transporter [Sporolactobacillus shoreicorticis]
MKRNYKLTVAAMCLGIFLCMLDTTIMNIALPAIQSGLNVSLESLSWAMNSYTIVFAVFTIPLGRVADRLGKNKVYVVGLVMFGLGSLLSGLASSSGLFTGRSIQSLGAAIVFPASMIIGISQVAIEKRKNVIAALGITQGLAAALGPAIGGIVTQFFGWRWVFLVNIPVLIVALCLSLMQLTFKNEKKLAIRLDLGGSLLSMLFLFTLTLALVKGNDWGWGTMEVICLFLTCLAAFVGFIFYEMRISSPMIPMGLFKNRQFTGSALAAVLSQLFLVGVMVILPTFLTRMQNETELTAALLVTPVSMTIFIFAPIAGLLIDRFGPRVIIFSGFFLMALAYFSYYHLDVTQNYQQLIWTCIVLGAGYGLIVGPITTLAAADFTGELLTASQSMVGVLRQLGSVLAVAIFISGLTGTISHAEGEAIHYSKKQISRLTLPVADRDKMDQHVTLGIKNQSPMKKSAAISDSKEQSMISSAYHHQLTQMGQQSITVQEKRRIHSKVEAQVKAKVVALNQQIQKTMNRIQTNVSMVMKDAFSSLYGWGIPFVFASSFITFIYEKKEKKRTLTR